jgi:hypothetical protein
MPIAFITEILQPAHISDKESARPRRGVGMPRNSYSPPGRRAMHGRGERHRLVGIDLGAGAVGRSGSPSVQGFDSGTISKAARAREHPDALLVWGVSIIDHLCGYGNSQRTRCATGWSHTRSSPAKVSTVARQVPPTPT